MRRRRSTAGEGREAGGPAIARRSIVLLLLVGVLGFAGTAAAAFGLRRAEERFTQRAADQEAARTAQAVTDGVRRYGDYLTGLVASVGAQQRLEAGEFAAITAPVDRATLPGVAGIAYVVPSSPAEQARVQSYWRARGVTGLVLRPARLDAGQHLFIVLGHSADGIPTPVGADLTTAQPAVDAMRAAQRTREPVMSATYQLRKDLHLPAVLRQPSFVLVAAIYATSPARDAGRLRGWLLLSLRSGDFLHAAIGAVAGQAASVELSDLGAGGAPLVRWDSGRAGDPGQAARRVIVEVPGRTWQLTIRPTTRLVTHHGPPAHLIAVFVGTVVSLLLLALTATVVTSRDRAVRRVREATEALRTDIDRREAVEQRLRRREVELRGFAGIVAHDLRAPLARIIGYTDLLDSGVADRLEPDEQDMLRRLRGGATDMAGLIDDLLGYATADNRPLRAVPVDLGPVVAEISREWTGPGQGDGPVFAVGPLPVVAGDRVLLRQVFDNLVGNAVKYCDPARRPRIAIGSRLDHGRWRIEIADNGIGIPADQLENVFDPFARVEEHRHRPGTGLGLAIVRRIVQRHGGEVGVEPDPAGGSRFWFTLSPAAEHDQEVERPAASARTG